MRTSLVSILLLMSHALTGSSQTPPEVRFAGNTLPPSNGVYVTPALFHQAFSNGIVISNISHRFFTGQLMTPPLLGATQVHTFGSRVEFDQAGGPGLPTARAVANGNVSVKVVHSSNQGTTQIYDTEMLQLDIQSGASMRLRESPTKQSLGRTTVRPAADGSFLISSFFDIFTELSTDGGQSWTAAAQPTHVELRLDPTTIPPIPSPSNLLPPRNDLYVSPALYHLLFTNGIVIKDVRHSFFTGPMLPAPPPYGNQQHQFGSQIDYQVSMNGGQTFTHGRAPATVSVMVRHRATDGATQIYDTEMLSLAIQGGDLISGNTNIMLRESPTKQSLGGTAVTPKGDGTYSIDSFFDIFTELSMDGGQNWTPAQEPARVTLICETPERAYPTQNLPPIDGQYVSPQQYHALFAQGIIISNVSHSRFTQSQPPPPAGPQPESFSSHIGMMLFKDGKWSTVGATANVTVQMTSSQTDPGGTRFFDTEMLSLNLQGGSLPPSVMIRESPSKASLGRTSIRQDPATGAYRISSFFDIFPELSLDNGQTWMPTLSGPVHMGLADPAPNAPVAITCPAPITVNAVGPAGAAVTYSVGASGGCDPAPSVVCTPASGSTFSVGTWFVTCQASDTCGQQTSCSFMVTVMQAAPVGTESFFAGDLLPPANGVYVSPQQFHASYANGIILRNPSHRFFTHNLPPPPLGGSQVHQFGSTVEFEASSDNGATFFKHKAPAQVSVRVTSSGGGGGSGGAIRTFDTEMLQLDISGGSMPPGVMIRESPSKASLGKTSIRTIPGGYMIGSFFDIFTELSLDGGQTWSPTAQPAHVELRPDATLIPPIPASTPLLPPPNDAYVSPARYHALYAQGIVIKDVRHSYFTQSISPLDPAAGGVQFHSFGSLVDLQLSRDGGQTWVPVRAPAQVSVQLSSLGSSPQGGVFDTEMTQLDISGGDLPPGMMIRESPTEPSRGGVSLDLQSDGTYRIGSFFDIFTEVTLDNGQNWLRANAPTHVELQKTALPTIFPTNNLPPPSGQYISPALWHALYANGIIISNISHQKFTQTFPPPLNGTDVHSNSSVVDMMVWMNGTWTHATASADFRVRMTRTMDYGTTSFFETEMEALSLHGGGLPPNVMIRESPSKASLGRTSIRQDPGSGQYAIDSFFDIFTELSLDGGQTWSAAVSPAATVGLTHFRPPTPFAPFTIFCPSNLTVNAIGSGGAAVSYGLVTYVFPDCPFGPFSVTCSPPSGSVFPIGTTVVTCTGSDGCNEHPTCSFNVTVNQNLIGIYFPLDRLPPPFGIYLSPTLSNIVYPNGVIIRSPRQHLPTQSFPPPPLGQSQVFPFSSTVEFEHSMDGGMTFEMVSAPAQVSVRVTGSGSNGTVRTFSTEMLQLDISGGSLPPGVMLRESPTRQSTGQTTVRTVSGGYMISSFFDVFTELSVDGGATWSPAAAPIHLELRSDSARVTPVGAPSPLLPPPNGRYVSPAQYHQAYAAGIIISNISHKFFTQSHPPPPPGTVETHDFDSQVDVMLSMDGGHTFRPARIPAAVSVRVNNPGSSGETGVFDTEMLALRLQGGDLPPNVMIRESPTEPSRGSVGIDALPDGTYRIGSFFDIFTELSLDGGQSWSPATNGPGHVELVSPSPEQPFPDPTLPPPNGTYISPALYHALYTNGIVISNVSHLRFTGELTPPPPPGGSQTHAFNSTVQMQVSMNGGSNFGSVISAQAICLVRVNSTDDDFGDTRFFQTEMLQLDISGGGLGPNIRVRESPSKASLGRTSVRQTLDGDYFVSSFFDIWTELSTDNGVSWSPALSSPITMAVTNPAAVTVKLSCPSNITVTATAATGATVTYGVTATGGCPPGPPTIVCNPPSGSVFPIGTTAVSCIARDTCGNQAVCRFLVTVRPQGPIEFDKFDFTTAQITLQFPDGSSEVVSLAGPSAVNAFVGPTGAASDSDGNGRDQVKTEMVLLDLEGNSSMGPVHVTLDPAQRTYGEIEENANNTPGILDVPPFAAAGTASSFFDVFAEIEVAGQVFHPAQALHMTSTLHHKPPAPGDIYVNPFTQPIPLLDANGNPTGVTVVREVHTPNPGPEIDIFTNTTADITIQMPNGGTEVVHLTGPTTVQVGIPPNGQAADTDGDGLDQVPTKMTQLDLAGTSSIGAVHVTLNTNRPTLGEIQEQVNNTPGVLDVPPFAATGAADSFFDVFMTVQIGGLALHNDSPVHMQAVIHHKPPGPGDSYVNPFTQPVDLLDANGNATGIRVIKEVHTPGPGPGPEVDVMNFGLAQITLSTPAGGTETITLTGPSTITVATTPTGQAADTDGNGRDQVTTEMISLDLHGNSSMGPVHVTLDPAHRTLGQIEEVVNSTPGILDVPPFRPTGTANSFFDVFAEIQVGGQVFHPAQSIHMTSVIHHKPPAPGDTYTNPFTIQVPLLDANGNPTGLYIIKEVHIPNPPVEVDHFPYTTADITVQMANGGTEVVHLSGPTTVQVTIPPNGMAGDSDGNGRDEVPTIMTQLDLTGTSSLGPVHVTLDAARSSLGEIEEQVNNTPGILDVPPFTATGSADSFFDVFLDIQIGGLLLHNDDAVHMQSVIHHKPPAPGDTYVNPFTKPVQLKDTNGNPTGITIIREVHIPTPGPEVDVMSFGLAQITLSVAGGGTETVTLAGPATVNVAIDNAGHATDSDGNGLDQVTTEMVNLDLHGNSPSLGPVHVTLDPAHHSTGQIEELANATPGILDVPPFTANGAANSFFDVFVKIEAGGQVFYPTGALRMASIIHHKPPASGDTYTNVFTQPVPLLDANGNLTGRSIIREVHIPNPPVEIDQFPNTTADITVQTAAGGTEVVHLTGPTTVQVMIPPNGMAGDSDGDGRDQVATKMTLLDLTGTSTLGPVHVTLAPGQPALGEIEEQVNNTPGVLDVPPFTATGSADSFFDVFFQIQIGGLQLYNATPVHMSSVIHHKPPAPGDTYVNPFTQPLQLVDANGNPAGISIIREVHTPTPTTNCTNSITCPSNIVAWTCVASGTKVTFTATAANSCGSPVTIVCNPASGGNFAVGNTPVTCTASSSSGNPVTCGFTVTVRQDTQPPQLVCPAGVATNTCGDREIVFYNVTATDDSGIAPTVTCRPPSGTLFASGTTVVTCIAVDGCNHTNTCTFPVTVVPQPLPKLTITIVQNNVFKMCWNTPCPGYRLQCARGFELPVQWQNVTNAVTVLNGTNYCVIITNQPNRQFYRVIRYTPNEVPSPTNSLPPTGSYNSPSSEQTVFANGLIARWFVHRIPPLLCPPNCPQPPCPTCPDPLILSFPTTIDFQFSSDGGKNFQNASASNVTARVSVHGSIGSGSNGPVSTLDMEMLSLTISNLPGVLIRESPTLASTGKHVIRTVDGGYRIGSFFDVFLELSTDGGQSWQPSLTPTHVDYNAPLASNSYQTNTFPPVGSYDSVSNVPVRYLNGVIARNIRHRILPPALPKPPPCLTCPPDLYNLPAQVDMDVSKDGGQTFQHLSAPAQSQVMVRHSQDTIDTGFFDTEMLSFSLIVDPAPGSVMLRESPTRASTGKTTVQRPASSGGSYRIGSFFDIFTEISLDNGASWSPAIEPTSVELHNTGN